MIREKIGNDDLTPNLIFFLQIKSVQLFRMSFLFSNRSSKTFKPKKNIPEGSHQHELMKHANATLGSGRRRRRRRR